jgi:hypothetical protein
VQIGESGRAGCADVEGRLSPRFVGPILRGLSMLRRRLLPLVLSGVMGIAFLTNAGLARADTLLHVERGGIWATVTPSHNKFFITWVNTNDRKLKIEYIEKFASGKTKTLKLTLKPHQQLQDKHHKSKERITQVLFAKIDVVN